ncbi:MAG TPA: hypothetical protein VKB78_14670 [Pirellulales bacterium]|nr:hypothetical protein [Pirellulales bacterium]
MNGFVLFAAPPIIDPVVIFAAIIILVLIIRVIGAVIAAGNNPNMPPRRPPGPPRLPQPPDGDSDALRGEIEEFLKRVSNRREGQPQRPPGAPPRPPGAPGRPGGVPPRPTPVIRTPPSVPPQERRRRPPVVVATASTPTLEVVEPVGPGGDIDEHVKRYMSTRQFDQRAGQLTSIDEKERQFDRQVQKTFAHEVGHLRPSALSIAGDDRSVSEIAPKVIDDQNRQNKSFGLLTGKNLINAVIISEIMQRPEHRW